ncbi:hypothetical protein C0991_008515 [Blastosporella zonata]|nr:hypothetical protein C0991_001388 [Blastosporella zonata]KAG6846328.1 hypothetical protein C0991_003632 [Blastosporella zonata]KAG6863054.1 hypothetical protein C0991_008515 [Blastosporella zonata]
MMVREYQRRTPLEFWAEFTEAGKHMSYLKISHVLSSRQNTQYAEDVQRAHGKYGDQFSSMFSYVKRGKTHTMTDPCQISK